MNFNLTQGNVFTTSDLLTILLDNPGFDQTESSEYRRKISDLRKLKNLREDGEIDIVNDILTLAGFSQFKDGWWIGVGDTVLSINSNPHDDLSSKRS